MTLCNFPYIDIRTSILKYDYPNNSKCDLSIYEDNEDVKINPIQKINNKIEGKNESGILYSLDFVNAEIFKNLKFLEEKVNFDEEHKNSDNLLEIRIKTPSGDLKTFNIEKNFINEKELLKNKLAEFIKANDLNEQLIFPIINKIYTSITSLKFLLTKKLSDQEFEDMIVSKSKFNDESNYDFEPVNRTSISLCQIEDEDNGDYTYLLNKTI